MKRLTVILIVLGATFFFQSLCYAQESGISVTVPEKASPRTIERKQLFDYNWKFFLGDIPDARSKDFNSEGWRNLDLPHDWSSTTTRNRQARRFRRPTSSSGTASHRAWV